VCFKNIKNKVYCYLADREKYARTKMKRKEVEQAIIEKN
jgi:hypothetical protein